VLALYQPARLKSANAHARTTLAWNTVWNHSASARRCVGLRLFSQRLAQHVLVQREVSDQLLQAPILVLHLPQPAQLADAEVGILLLPIEKGRLADAGLPADIRHRHAALRLPQRVRYLLLGKRRPLHRSLLLDGTAEAELNSNSGLPYYSGGRSHRRCCESGSRTRLKGPVCDGDAANGTVRAVGEPAFRSSPIDLAIDATTATKAQPPVLLAAMSLRDSMTWRATIQRVDPAAQGAQVETFNVTRSAGSSSPASQWRVQRSIEDHVSLLLFAVTSGAFLGSEAADNEQIGTFRVRCARPRPSPNGFLGSVPHVADRERRNGLS
jgi:hypothetical protein